MVNGEQSESQRMVGLPLLASRFALCAERFALWGSLKPDPLGPDSFVLIQDIRPILLF